MVNWNPGNPENGLANKDSRKAMGKLAPLQKLFELWYIYWQEVLPDHLISEISWTYLKREKYKE
jgi:hypothetical protein